jgi:hypothetical protein
MSQGRDLIVSFFEPDGLYGKWRVFFTTAAVIIYSVCMWIVPAFMFQLRERNSRDQGDTNSPFHHHLFFIHRVLPMIPFWLLASTLFNSGRGWFFLAAIVLVAFHFWFNHTYNSVIAYKKIIKIISVILALTTTYFLLRFQKDYTSIKVIYAVNLYLLSSLIFFVYHYVDERILNEHKRGDDAGQSVYSKYRINTFTYLTIAVLHIVIVVLIFYRPFHLSFAPESLLLYMFSVYVFVIDLFSILST